LIDSVRDGSAEADTLGPAEGEAEGAGDGGGDGFPLGTSEGLSVGATLGLVGLREGTEVSPSRPLLILRSNVIPSLA